MLIAEKEVPVSHEAFHGLLDRLSDARRRSDALFSIVRTESLYARPIPERHRIIFYVGHLEAFDWNLLSESILGPGTRTVHPELDRLFAFGIDPVGGGLPTDLASDWPSLDTVRGYVQDIRSALDKRLAELIVDADVPTRDGFSLDTLLNVAIEHRLMHVETLAYMLHRLPHDGKVRITNSSRLDGITLASSPVVPRSISIPAGVATLGLAHNTGNFGWDNEFEAHTVEVPAFEVDQYKVTNGQYLEFIAAGGYGKHGLWSGEGWNWKTEQCITHPSFWSKDGDRWLYRTMFDVVPLPLDWPVYVSQAEASAYAQWVGKSLPTEAQWQRAAYGAVTGSTNGSINQYPWGDDLPNADHGNFDFHSWDPTVVNAFPKGRSGFGVDDMLGNGWEWTSTVFAPFTGFQAFPFYRGYSADFFDGKHFVMKGGSARTAACMLRATFRNWFQPHYQYVYAGFRCVSR